MTIVVSAACTKNKKQRTSGPNKISSSTTNSDIGSVLKTTTSGGGGGGGGCSKKVTTILRGAPEQTEPTTSTCPPAAASIALKGAETIRRCAENTKGISRLELFLEAAMQFLFAGSLIEQQGGGNPETAANNARDVYHSAATLSKYCAHEYESCGNMAFAALAHKCAEVTYMRMMYSAHVLLNREAPHPPPVIPPVLSPSSPTSCVIDNNNLEVYPNYSKLVELAQDADHAMNASRKSRQAFAAATAAGNMVDSVKSTINHSFYDVDQFILRVHQAMAVPL